MYPTPKIIGDDLERKLYGYFTQDAGVLEWLTTDTVRDCVGRYTDFYKRVHAHRVDYTSAEHG